MDYKRNKQLKPRLLTEEELVALEQQNPDGLSSAAIVDAFASRNIKFSEATFRKYVQLGLLPRSRRVGTKGKHKGSRGVYPAGTVRQINEIKRLMTLDFTIEEIRQQFAFVGGELEELRRLLERLLGKLEESAAAEADRGLAAEGIRRRIDEVRGAAEHLMQQLEETAKRIREQARIARDAV